MNATELYEVVKDVPREAWPVHPDCECDFYWRTDTPHSNPEFWWKWRGQWSASEPCASLLFECSMMRWLIGEGFHSFNFGVGDNEVVLELYDITVRIPLDAGSKVQTQTRLLAAACKAVAEASN